MYQATKTLFPALVVFLKTKVLMRIASNQHRERRFCFMNDPVSQDTKDALEMIGVPVIQFEPPSRQVIQTISGEFKAVTTTGWVKLALSFRNVMALLRGAKLAVYLSICLHVNEEGKSWPSMRTISKETGLDKGTVSNAVRELESIPGLLEITRRHGTSNLYSPSFVVYGKSVHTPPEKAYTPPRKKRTEVEPLRRTNEEENTTRAKPTREPSETYAIALALSEVCRMDMQTNKGRLLAEAKTLLLSDKPHPTPELITQHYNGDPRAFWKTTDWRGKKGQLPKPSNIRETWGQWGTTGVSAEVTPNVSGSPAMIAKLEKYRQEHPA